MNPTNNGYQPDGELPQLQQPGEVSISSIKSEVPPASTEAASVAMELPSSSPLPTQPPVGTYPITDPLLQVQSQSNPLATPSLSGHSPAIADDVDVIEKEWVIKAKAIVAQTKDDPHLQNKEINKFKADYVKKRYNREIKIAQD